LALYDVLIIFILIVNAQKLKRSSLKLISCYVWPFLDFWVDLKGGNAGNKRKSFELKTQLHRGSYFLMEKKIVLFWGVKKIAAGLLNKPWLRIHGQFFQTSAWKISC
jgi:hypothetical protein